MKQLFSLILLAPLAACSGDPGGAAGAPDAGTSDDGGADVDASTPAGPDLSCLSQPPPSPPTMVVDPMTLAGRLVELTTTGVKPVGAAEVALFRAGQPVVLARTNSAANGAFTTGAVATNGHAVHAYVKGTKPGYRTAFYYPPSPFTVSSSTLVVPTISDAAFATVKTLLGATQDDARNGALLVAVLDCDSHPLPGATLSVRRGSSPVGHTFDLSAAVPVDDGLFLVFDVPDGKIRVSATYQGIRLPEHEVVVRASDPECPTPRGTLTSTIVKPGA
jgi:hypothetical protein